MPFVHGWISRLLRPFTRWAAKERNGSNWSVESVLLPMQVELKLLLSSVDSRRGHLGRRNELSQYLDSLSGYISPLTVGVIERSLQKWGDIAADPTRRTQPDAMTALEAQAIVWHDLLVSAHPPETLIDSSEPLAVVRSLRPLLRALWPQILLGLLFVIALCAGAWLLTSVASLRGAGAALAVLGAFGVSATTISAKAKDEANRLVERLRTAYQLEAAAEAGVKLPASKLPAPKRKLGLGRRPPQKPS